MRNHGYNIRESLISIHKRRIVLEQLRKIASLCTQFQSSTIALEPQIQHSTRPSKLIHIVPFRIMKCMAHYDSEESILPPLYIRRIRINPRPCFGHYVPKRFYSNTNHTDGDVVGNLWLQGFISCIISTGFLFCSGNTLSTVNN